ncbi:DUF1654 domain-containing protein [Pseudomonas tohonis]|uniref:DUF1654 domain-containing protein n=1 Tax=Pseudomonas tohonis TaxID=2725477 RepID=UPI001F2B653A|nr:DUF1654 domain-containing protein [Pseudomonas tohonis]
MAKQKTQKQPERRVMSSSERLGLRVSEMINSPSAQLNRRVTIHRLDTDEDQAWEEVMELLAETDGLEMTFNDDGTVTLGWLQLQSDSADEGEHSFLGHAEVPLPL